MVSLLAGAVARRRPRATVSDTGHTTLARS